MQIIAQNTAAVNSDAFRLAYAPPADPINALPWRIRPLARFLSKPVWDVATVRRVEQLAGKVNDEFGCIDLEDADGDLALTMMVELQETLETFGTMAKRGYQGFPMAPNPDNVRPLSPVSKPKTPSKPTPGPTRPVEVIVSLAIEAIRQDREAMEGPKMGRYRGYTASAGEVFDATTTAERATMTRFLNTIGYAKDYANAKPRNRFAAFACECCEGSPVRFPLPAPPSLIVADLADTLPVLPDAATGTSDASVDAAEINGEVPTACSSVPGHVKRVELLTTAWKSVGDIYRRSAPGCWQHERTGSEIYVEVMNHHHVANMVVFLPDPDRDFSGTDYGHKGMYDEAKAVDVGPVPAWLRDFVNLTFDVVQHVKPGTMASYPAGSWLDASFSSLKQAREYAARCNLYRLVDGIEYEVVCTHNEDPNRRQSIADWKREQADTPVPSFPDPAPISGGSPEATVEAEDATSSALEGLARLARVEPEADDDDEPARVPTGPVDLDSPWVDRFAGLYCGMVLECVERARDKDRRDSPLAPWRLVGEEARQLFVRWFDRIGYRVEVDCEWLRFDSFLTDCVEGSPVDFPDPTGPEGDDDETLVDHDQRCSDRADHGSHAHGRGLGGAEVGSSGPGRPAGPAAWLPATQGPDDAGSGIGGASGGPAEALRGDRGNPPAVEWSDALGCFLIDWARDQAATPLSHFSPDDPYVTIPIDGRAYGVTFRDDCLMLEKADGMTHEIVKGEYGLECSCPSWEYRCKGLHGAQCKHTKAVMVSGFEVPTRLVFFGTT